MTEFIVMAVVLLVILAFGIWAHASALVYGETRQSFDRQGAYVPTTHVLDIIDMSGSMYELASDVRGGYNAYRKELLEGGGDYRMTVVTFDTEISLVCENTPIAESPELTKENYLPRGNTALLDGVGTALMRFRQATRGPDDKVSVMIQTDGLENSSVEYTRDQIVKLLAEVQQEGWAVIYAGQGPQAWAERHGYGVAHTSVSVPQTSWGTRSLYRSRADVTRSYAAGQTAAADFAEEVQKGVDG